MSTVSPSSTTAHLAAQLAVLSAFLAFMAAPATSQPMDTLHQLASSDYKVYFVKGSVQVPVDLPSTPDRPV